MTLSLNKSLQSLLNDIQNAPKHPYVNNINECIKLMLECFDNEKINNKERLKELNFSLFRLITDDYDLYKSEIGVKIDKVMNQISEAI